MFSLAVSRRRAMITALILLMGAFWLVRNDQARAGLADPPQGEGIDVVYVAVSSNFPDALGVGPGAGVNNAPIILVPTDPPLPGYTSAELVRLDPQKVVIVGGTGVVSQAMQDAIEALLPNATVERLAGSNRYETNTLFTQSVYPVESWASIHTSAFVAHLSSTATHGPDFVYGNDVDLYAPIQLPHGATILELRVGGYDGDYDLFEDVYVSLSRQCAVSNPILMITSSGGPGSFDLSDTTPAAGFEVVDNENCLYFVVAALTDSDNYLKSVRVKYRLGTPGA